MKPNLLFKLLCLLFLPVSLATAQTGKGGGYSIRIKVKGLAPKDTCILACFYGDKNYIKDTAVADANSVIEFNGPKNLENGNYLVVLPKKNWFNVMVKEQKFSMETDTADFVKSMKVTKSKENQLYYDYLRFIAGRRKKVDSMLKELGALKDEDPKSKSLKDDINKVDKEVKGYIADLIHNNNGTFVAMMLKAAQQIEIPENPNPKDSTFAYRYMRQHFFDNIDFSNDDILRTPVFHDKINYYLESLTYKIPDSINVSADYLVSKARANKELFKYVVNYITYTYEVSQWIAADAVMVHMVKKYYTPDQVFWLDTAKISKIVARAKILEPLLIGKKAPQLFLQDTSAALNSGNTNGKKFYPLHSVAAKYTVMVFFDPECGHCRKEVPKLYNEFYKKYRSKGVEVYAINATHSHLDSWKKFINENKFDWINVHDSGPYYRFDITYDIHSFPVIYLLDEEKKIIAKKIGVDDLPKIIDDMEQRKVK